MYYIIFKFTFLISLHKFSCWWCHHLHTQRGLMYYTDEWCVYSIFPLRGHTVHSLTQTHTQGLTGEGDDRSLMANSFSVNSIFH